MYTLQFVSAALDEWNHLDGSVKETFRTELRKKLEQPELPGSAL